MTRIAHLTSVHSALDARIFAKECASLAAAGHDVHLVAPHTADETISGVHIHAVEKSRSRWTRMIQTTHRVYRKALELRADVYHFHDPELLLWGVRLQKKLGVPVIYDSHEFFALDVREKPYLPRFVSIPLAQIVGAVERFAVKRLAGVVAVNEPMARDFHAYHVNVASVANYPPLAYAKDVPPGIDRIPNSAIFTGPMEIARGFVNVFDAMQIVRREKPDATCAILGGLHRTRLPERILRIADDEFREYGVELLKPVRPAEVPAIASRYAVGWIPSWWQESFLYATPIKLIEFMALGMPVVASDLPTIREIVESADCGILVDPTDPNAHAQALLTLWNDPVEAARLGANGRRAVKESYHWERQLPNLLDVYRRAAESLSRSS